eukprot:COSAG02_NODE_198_length_29564_cov_12.279009_21_plen_75_part_00
MHASDGHAALPACLLLPPEPALGEHCTHEPEVAGPVLCAGLRLDSLETCACVHLTDDSAGASRRRIIAGRRPSD